jgi:hypothetical protein
MSPPPQPSRTSRFSEAMLLSAAAIAAAVIMTWPLVTGLGHLGRTQNSGDARFAVWNVAWVAHALTTDPGELFDANIFFPHRQTLAYSEANVGAGALAVPAWLATRNPFTALNVVVLFGFAASVVATFLLARRLTDDGGAAATAAVLFAFCPYVFAHTAHIQLLMVAGIPLTMLMLHRLVDVPSPRRGLALGAALSAQALSCAYYGIFVGLAVGYATLFYAWSRKYWKASSYWLAIGIAAGVSVGIVVPFFLPYLRIQEDTGFARSLDDARHWSAYWRSYLASGAHAHGWLLPLIRDWNNAVLFPGFVSIGLGVYGAAVAWQRRPSDAARPRDRETLLLYGSIGLLALWASLGPRAGLYTVLYYSIPVFSFLRAPERMGIVVMLCLAVLSAYAVRALRQRFSGAGSRAVAVAACGLALLELNDIPFDWRQDSVPAVYRVLARMPRGALAEFPFYDRRIDFHIHSRYMLFSTAHWQPLVNGYSDHIPADFRTLATTLATFPSRESFDALRERHVRYISIHRGRQGYGGATAPEIERRLQPYLQNLRPVADDGNIAIYEIVSWPR